MAVCIKIIIYNLKVKGKVGTLGTDGEQELVEGNGHPMGGCWKDQ